MGGTIRDDKVTDSFYTNPTVDPAAGRINYTDGFCSGVVVAQDWVLTAKHCLTNDPNFTSFTTGDGITYPIDVAKPFVAEPNGADLALFHILPSLTTGTLPSASVVATRYRGTAEVGNVATHIGYGYGGTGTTGSDPTHFPQGVRRGGDNRIADYAQIDINNKPLFSTVSSPELNYLYEPFDSPPAAQTPFEWCAAIGDSGGGAFMDVNGSPQLVGIHDLLLNGNSQYGDATFSLRVTDYNAWIDSTVPEPSCASMVMLTGMLLRRRASLRPH
jgi:secreted trypsin-like serine protease